MQTPSALLLLLSMPLWTVAMAQDRNSDEELVRSLDDQERIAALKRDVSALEGLWSEQFTVNAREQPSGSANAPSLTFVRAGVINFSTSSARSSLSARTEPFVFIMGLETVKPISDAQALVSWPGKQLSALHDV